MKTMKLLKTLTLATGLISGVAATAGDLYEIRPCDKDGVAVSAYSTADTPLSAGETLYFKLRLIPRTLGGHLWMLGYTSPSSKIMDEYLNPLQIGIYVSGQLKYATLVGEVYNTTAQYSDFIFSYTTAAGDFALPIVLATENGPADEVSGSEFYLNPLRSDKWALVNVDLNSDGRPQGYSTDNPLGASDTCSLQYWVSPGVPYVDPGCYDGSKRETDCTLKSAGFYVKTLDFDDNWEEEPGEDPTTDPGLWRSVHEGSSSTVGNTPQIVSEAGALAEKATLYVWSDDESAVYVKGGTLTEITTGYVAGVAQTMKVHMGTVTLAGGSTSANFSIWGVKEGGKANLVLSPYAGFRFDATKDLITDNYITVPVACVEPLPTSIVVEREDKTVSTFTANTVSDDGYLNAITRVAVYPTQAPTADITVTVNPTFQADTTKTNWGDYIRFSTQESVETLPAGDTAPTVTFTAGSTERQYLYVYALRSEKAYTIGTGKQIQLIPTADAAAMTAAGISTLTGTGLNIDANAPTINSPTAETTLSATAGDTLDVPIAIDDIFADYTDKTTGYTVTMTFNGLSQTQSTTFIPAGEGEQLVGKDDDTILPQIKIPSTLMSGDYTATVKVTSPIRKLASAVTTFKVTVAGAKTMSAALTDTESEGVYNEGETIGFKINLSDAPGTEVYAFLVTDEDDISGLFGGANASAILGQNDLAAAVTSSSGIKISAAGTSVTGRFQVLDGSQDGTPYAFNVILCSSKRYNPDNVVKGYANSDGINLTIYNVEPAFDASEPCYVNGFAVADGELFGNEYPKGQTQTIKPNFTDVAYDLRHGFQYKYTITQGTKSAANGTVGHTGTDSDITVAEGTSINTAGFTYNFPNAGTYTIKIQMKDKDMDSWAAATMAFQINIVNSPVLSVAMDDGYESYLETMNKAHVNVTLPYYPDTGIDQVVVKVTVTPPEGTNPGELKLDNEYKTVPAGYAALADNEYYVVFTEKATEPMLIDSMDGTTLSVAKGFSVTAEVMNTEPSIEEGKTWAEYYKAGSGKIYIENVTPVFVNVTLENTNAWKVAGGAASSYPIKFTIRSDVDEDLAGITSFPGIKVTLSANDGTVKPTPANGTWNEFYVTDAGSSYTFTPDFGSLQGDQTVTLTIEDKDGGYQSWTYLYTVEASKVLITRAAGPSGGTANQPSPKYANAEGHGEGRVWADGMKISSGTGHDFKWNCSKEQRVSVYGYGYKTGDTEAATLPGVTSYRVNAAGGIYVDGDTAYAYGDDTFDSFLYTWLVYTSGEGSTGSSGQLTASLLSGIAPETPGKTLAAARLALPTEQLEDGSYQESEIEGVFSKEWRKDDNCGDINQDGIPDLAIQKYGLGVYDVDAGEVTGNDLSDVSAYNDDEDYLPAGSSGGNALLPHVGNDWSTQGLAFNAYLELRGFGVGLNAGYPNGDGSAQTPDYTANEQRAYLAWKGLAEENALKAMTDDEVATLFEANLADAAADLSAATTAGTVSANNGKVTAGWSPENPTDPTVEDSDHDGLPDGYEYWFWYAAKVGYYDKDPEEGGKWEGRLQGRYMGKFENGQGELVRDLERFDPIPSDDICAAFNPNVNGEAEGNAATRGSIASRDFDGDGLTDLEELAIGTNPVDCDTDNDGLPDGWEVMWGLNPLSTDDPEGAGHNPDGDYMAAAAFEGVVLSVQNVDDDGNPVADDEGNPLLDFYLYNEFADVNPGDTVEVNYMGRAATLDDVLMTLGDDTIPTMVSVASKVTFAAEATIDVSVEGITLVHDQVRMVYGFDPRTAWSGGHGTHPYVCARWCPLCNDVDLNIVKANEAGYVVNTRAYSNRDEYLYGKYAGLNMGDDVLDTLKKSCTNPNVNFEEKTYGDFETPFTSTQHGADTNGDGVPDGWCIYCGGDPIDGSWGGTLSDLDELPNAAEFAGTDTCAAYASCPSISNNLATAGWTNKFFPSDPHSADTDGDGIDDFSEGAPWQAPFYAGRQAWIIAGYTFIYDSGIADDGYTLCLRGGGMNPCSSDTDFDGLPDGWEHEFAGIAVNSDGSVVDSSINTDEMYTDALKINDGFGSEDFAAKGAYLMGGMDATDGGDAVTVPGTKDAVTGTIRDRDFDRDGLENFQEYLVQAVRLWRYDDAETPLNGRAIVWTGSAATTRLTTKVESEDAFLPMNILDGGEMVDLVKSSPFWAELEENSLYFKGSEHEHLVTNGVSVVGGEVVYDTEMVTDVDQGVTEYDYKAMGYMAKADHVWDPFHQAGLAAGALYGYGYMRHPNAMVSYELGTGPVRSVGSTYVSTDPRQWDTDSDGMDDFWEIFHGLDPILGATDVIATSYAAAKVPVEDKSDNNVWGGFDGMTYPRMADEGTGYDPMLRPWRMGLAEADPDGDGLRNVDEAISGNLTSPTTYHTDPTPLWMTDGSSAMSYVSQYYRLKQGAGDLMPDLQLYPWAWTLDLGIGSGEGESEDYRYSIDQTEGYDTDGDFRSDASEVVKSVMPMSDPLDATDPDRRAALYLSGENSLACSYMEGNVPVVDAYDIFRQFTVECWVKPEKTDAEQTILERGFVYNASNLENSSPVWRANFRIGLNETGNVYGLFDNDNAVTTASDSFSTQRVVGDVLPKNEWSHVALTFDGTNLTLYVNGQYRKSAMTALIPANGVTGILQEPGDTNLYPMATYQTAPGMNTIGARRTAIRFSLEGGFNQFADFYQGYVAEVRFWDGARTAAQIASTYKVRMTKDDVAANREAVYQAWEEKNTRSDADGTKVLPPQLMCLFNFQQLPAAVNAEDVAQTPSGFFHVLENCSVVDKTLAEVGWWSEMTTLHSSVYADYHVVPWIENTVSHLPFLDDSFADSQYWSEPYAGYTSASANGVETYAIPNGGNPYPGRAYKSETDLHYFRLVRKALYEEAAQDKADRFAFQLRSEFVGLDDLIPLGDAYAKIDADYWDGQGAATAWSDTGADTDGDGLPDWWENLHGGTALTPDTVITYNGDKMPAWQAYMRDLAKGMQPSGSVDKTYASTADGDADGIVDWWQNLYSLTGGANGDADGDGLANYVEYLLSEVFKIDSFDPTDAFSVNAHASDYFVRVGQSYVGEIFTDHDRIDDTWEDKFSNTYASRYLYDALSDPENDGWSNYAEFQAGTDPTKLASLGVDAVQMTEYPVPTIETTITYEGTQNVGDVPFVVKAWRDATLQTIPDAVWTIGGDGTTQVYENGSSNTVTGLKYVGMNPGKEMLLHLSPGSIVAGSLKMEFKDQNWILYNYSTGQAYFNDPATAVWYSFVIDRQRTDDADKGDIIVQSDETVIGEIDYVTGAVTIDFSLIPSMVAIDGDVSGSTTTSGTLGGGNYISIYQLDSSYVRINWNAQPITGGSSVHYYLADADARTSSNNSLGHIKEGRNTFVAFCDLDGDGNYTAGEPFGIAPNVDVGWNYAKVNIELTDTTPVTARFSVGAASDGSSSSDGESSTEASNDRAVLWGTESGNYDVTKIAIGKESGGVFERVRVVRTLINGIKSTEFGVPNCVVLDKIVNVNNDPYLTEADFLQGDNLDIDWATLADDLAKGSSMLPENISNVTYRIVLGNGSVEASVTNNLLGLAFNRWFDAPKAYANDAKPVTLGPGIVTASSPTFKWTIPNGLNSYTAFEIAVYDESGNEVWDSGFQPMPPRIKDADYGWRYEWTAPIFADDKTPNGKKVFANNKNYTWYVTIANARYKNSTNWSDGSAFRMNVLTNSADYGAMDVAVRYFGPTAVAKSGVIRVQAFATPDFSGSPVGEGYVKTLANIANPTNVLVANARIIGLEAGTYYVRAFIDTVADGTCENWESWGFACERDTKDSAIYTPKAIKVGPKVGLGEVVKVFIDDCDTDQDNLPDAWEWTQKGDLATLDVGSLDQELTGGVAVKKSLTDALSGSGSLTTGLAVMLSSSLNSPYVAAMVMGVDVSGASSASAAAAAVSSAVGTVKETAEPKTVRFTAISLDPTKKTVDLNVETVVTGGTTSGVDPAVSAIYEFETTGSLTVTFKLWKKSALTDASWKEITSERRSITVGEADTAVSLSLGEEVDLDNGFFKVTLEK